MRRPPWLGLALSLALHAGAIALVLAVISRDERLPALMVDLRDAFLPGPASVASSPRGERRAPPTSAPRPKRARSKPGKTGDASPAPQPLPPPSASAAPAVPPPPVPVVEAPSALRPAPANEPSREPAPLAAPPSREVAEPRASGSFAGAATAEAPPSVGGGRGVMSEITGGRGVTGGVPGGSDSAASGHGEGPSSPRVASVPPGGGGSGIGAEYGPYLTALRQRIQQSVRYPPSARRRGLAGTVSVEIVILANGTVGDVTLVESSSHSVLDEAALDTIRSLPRMPLPPELPARPLRVRVPVVFQMR